MTQIAGFFGDIIKRLFKPTPLFFRIVQIAGLVSAAVGKLPDYAKDLGININPVASPWKIVLLVAGLTTAIVAQLAVPNGTSDSNLQIK